MFNIEIDVFLCKNAACVNIHSKCQSLWLWWIAWIADFCVALHLC